MTEYRFPEFGLEFRFATRPDGHEVVWIHLESPEASVLGTGVRCIEVEGLAEVIEKIRPELDRRLLLRRAPMTAPERQLLQKLTSASLRNGSGDKRFVRTIQQLDPAVGLTDHQRRYLAILAWRYRRQYGITAEEKQFICAHFPVPESQRGAA